MCVSIWQILGTRLFNYSIIAMNDLMRSWVDAANEVGAHALVTVLVGGEGDDSHISRGEVLPQHVHLGRVSVTVPGKYLQIQDRNKLIKL